jgi:hypothetical protein
MVEFTEREKKLVHAMNLMNNPLYKDVPFEIKTRALQSVFLVLDYEWNESEMTDMMDAIAQETTFGNQSALKVLGKYGHMIKGIKKLG